MKLPKTFTIYDLRFTSRGRSSASIIAREPGVSGNRQSAIGNRQSQQGIALVITLILLSVTLFMAVAFLSISRRERNSVVTETGAVTARLAADSGLAMAEAQILATVLQSTNPYNFGLLVSTNYINADGFLSGSVNPTNVSYVYPNGAPLLPQDFIQNVANLWYLPRAPVFAYDRGANTNEFRFYLDLNRNRQFDANGWVGNVDNAGFTNGVNPFVFATGDPEWIGVLERPDAPHGPNNKFLSRYAFIVLPAGNTLDLNAIHNEVLNENLNASDGYFRNQGVGGWEINLAAFLADLNTNEWGRIIGGAGYYQYNRGNLAPGVNSGVAFDDARALLGYRYHYDYGTLKSFSSLFTNYPVNGGAVDLFPYGSIMTNAAVPFYNPNLNNFWPGSENTNHYFALASDLYDANKIQPLPNNSPLNFVDRLQHAGTNVSTYDRYTLYRLLAQLGTDSAPERDKLNVNYVNVDLAGNVIPDFQTNSISWEPSEFFTNAADRMLRAYTTKWFQASPSTYLAVYYGITNYNYYHLDSFGNTVTNDPTALGLTNVPFFGMTNQIPAFGVRDIPVLINSKFVYRPAVQRVLQLAANICDATTNRTFAFGKDYPSVFRPTFFRESSSTFTNLFVSGFSEVSSILPAALSTAHPVLDLPVDATDPILQTNASLLDLHGNVYGVPWVIGAKKNFPNFNEFSYESVVTVTRKLQLSRTNDSSSLTLGGLPMVLTATNQMYVFSITNYLGVECWNSYSNQCTNILIVARDRSAVTMTNEYGVFPTKNYFVTGQMNLPLWSGGWTNANTGRVLVANSFKLPLGGNGVTNLDYLPASAYRYQTPFNTFLDVGLNPQFENLPPGRLPQFGLLQTNRLQVFMLDQDASGGIHVIDYAHFNGPDSHRNLNAELGETSKTQPLVWDTNFFGNLSSFVPRGVVNQIYISAALATLVTPDNGGSWDQPAGLPAALRGRNGAIEAYFRGFLADNGLYTFGGKTYTNTEYVVQAPFTPTRTLVEYISWQANDPLVHYLEGDLTYSGAEPSSKLVTGVSRWNSGPPDILPGLGNLNERYQPWGKVHTYTGSDNNAYNTAYRDPLVRSSDDWEFPTYKLPAVGWLGRVHRGTPWQTVYLKATNVLTTSGIVTWTNWVGNVSRFDSTNTAPVQDRVLFDLFTTALNGNATRGQLPINVAAGDTNNPAAGLAAWSAVFSGLAVPTNRAGSYNILSPAGPDLTTNSPMYEIVANINAIRKGFTNGISQGGSFKRVGDILSVPQLTQRSRFLTALNLTNNVTDALMEWIPQQTMGLLRLSDQPRAVVYSYGQTLTPAPNGVVTSGAQAGMITNYQVTAETVTRSVIQIVGAPTNVHAVVESYSVLPPD